MKTVEAEAASGTVLARIRGPGCGGDGDPGITASSASLCGDADGGGIEDVFVSSDDGHCDSSEPVFPLDPLEDGSIFSFLREADVVDRREGIPMERIRMRAVVLGVPFLEDPNFSSGNPRGALVRSRVYS